MTARIICTIGPATDSSAVLKKVMDSGMAIARLNFSHGTHAGHLRLIKLIRKLDRLRSRKVRILQDLEGYRIRIGHLPASRPIALKKGQTVFLTNEQGAREKNLIPFDYDGSLKDIHLGSEVFIDDGNIVLTVRSRSGKSLKTEVIIPGLLKERKGINISGLRIPFKGLNQKDQIDLAFGIKHRVDYIAQSFVRGRQDIMAIRERIPRRQSAVKIIAKIENQQGIDNFDKILEVADGIMVARGDLGVAVPIYKVPMIQKWMIRKCNRKKKFVITATQMLESMTMHWRPTRAEVTDVANAVLDGTDFVMLSEETAAGKYPIEAVEMMREIVDYTEKQRLVTRG